jgi:hypothetical protein
LREAKLINDINRDRNWVELLFETWYIGIGKKNECAGVEIHCENNKNGEEGRNRRQHLARFYNRWLERIFLLRVSKQADSATVAATVGCYRLTICISVGHTYTA